MTTKNNESQYRANKKWRDKDPVAFAAYKFDYNASYYETNKAVLFQKRIYDRERKRFLAILI